MRLNKYLAHAGVASRRKCDELITRGLIKVNGKVAEDFSYQVQEEDVVQYKNAVIELNEQKSVYLLHKPAGVVSTSSDPQQRKTVMDLLPEKERLYTIGRLDRDTTGAILITNDGELAYKLTHPKFEIEKVYIVQTAENVSGQDLKRFSKGVELEDGSISRGSIRRLRDIHNQFIWEVILKEGKNREIKRLFTVFGTRVKRLHRQSFAGISADALKPGKYRRLSKHEVKALIDLNIIR